MAKGDVIKDVMREVLLLKPDLTAHDAMTLERRLRDRWGGARVYIGKGVALGKGLRLGAALAAGTTTLSEAFDRAGLSRRTGYRTARRKWYIR